MARVKLVVAPARLALGTFCKWTERITWHNPCAVDKTTRQSGFSSRQPQTGFGTFDRLRKKARDDPLQVLFGSIRWTWVWRYPPSVSSLHCFEHQDPMLLRYAVEQALAISWNKSIKIAQESRKGSSPRSSASRPRDWPTAALSF